MNESPKFTNSPGMKYLSKLVSAFFFTLLFTFATVYSHAKMAKPYVDGVQGSTLFGNKNFSVISEKIAITAIAPLGLRELDDYAYPLKYKISYRIAADRQELLPLLLDTRMMEPPKSVIINGKRVNLQSLNKQHLSRFKFLSPSSSGGDFYDIKFGDQTKAWGIQLQDLMYFEADMVQGENTIVVEYEGSPTYNVYGLLRKYEIQYALYPAKTWKSFGPIEVNLKLLKEDEVRNVNMGKLEDLTNGNYKLTIDKITGDDLTIVFSKKISTFAAVLLFVEPFGLAVIAFLIASFFHIKWLIKRRKQYPMKYNYTVPLGMFAVTIIAYGVFALGFDLIKWVMNDGGLKNGYILLIIFTAPFFFLIYGLITWLVDLQLKRKLKTSAAKLEIDGV